jgi:hypothetical protein
LQWLVHAAPPNQSAEADRGRHFGFSGLSDRAFFVPQLAASKYANDQRFAACGATLPRVRLLFHFNDRLVRADRPHGYEGVNVCGLPSAVRAGAVARPSKARWATARTLFSLDAGRIPPVACAFSPRRRSQMQLKVRRALLLQLRRSR